jgi:hypothetical protein
MYISLDVPICSLTIEFKLENKDSNEIDHFEGNNFLSLLPIRCHPKIKNKINIEYNAKLVKVKEKKPNNGALKLKRLITSNCSKGEIIKILNWLFNIKI